MSTKQEIVSTDSKKRSQNQKKGKSLIKKNIKYIESNECNSDNIVNIDIPEEPKPINKNNMTISKKEKYVEERKIVLNKLLKILGITGKNKVFNITELDNNEEKRKQILALIPDVKKYFNSSNWNCFTRKDIKKQCMSLTKAILKDMDYEFDDACILKNK